MLKNVLQICFVYVLNGILTSGLTVSPPNQWSTHLLQDRTSVIALQTSEPGFDLSDDEMKKFKLWPQGIISYYIDDFSFDKVLRDRIRSVLDIFSGLTGVHFIELHSTPLDERTRWVLFLNRRGLLACADHNSMNFTRSGVQKVVIGYDCIYNGGELAEVALAIVGVPPQHNAPNRDDYIKVNLDKIMPGKRYLYNKVKDSEWLFHDVKYDFASLSHYQFHAHSIDGSATIVPKQPVDIQVGEVNALSYTDVLKVRMLYNYISRKKYSNVEAPKCNKLFKPGSKFDKNRQKENNKKPRRKPNKYLGLPENTDDKQNTNEQEDANDNNENDNNENDNNENDNNENDNNENDNNENDNNENDDNENDNNENDNNENDNNENENIEDVANQNNDEKKDKDEDILSPDADNVDDVNKEDKNNHIDTDKSLKSVKGDTVLGLSDYQTDHPPQKLINKLPKSKPVGTVLRSKQKAQPKKIKAT